MPAGPLFAGPSAKATNADSCKTKANSSAKAEAHSQAEAKANSHAKTKADCKAPDPQGLPCLRAAKHVKLGV